MHNNYQAAVFRNKNGRKLYGILQQPEKARKDVAIIFLSPGIKNRVGPHRLYVKMAERFTKKGFIVLRVDPEGLGDSEGEIEQVLTADVYASIQLGRYIEDTISMMDWMEQKVGIRHFILTGLCGGAITALLASEKDERVQAILALGMPCILDSSAIDPSIYITEKQLNSIRGKYLTKVFNFKAWLRFLSFKSDYKLLTRSLLWPLRKTNSGNLKQAQNEAQNIPGYTPLNSNLNPHFHRAFLRFISKKKILLVFSGADRLYWEFEEKYLGPNQPHLTPFVENFRIMVVQHANHVFSFSEWQSEMIELSEVWLDSLSAKISG